MIPAPIPGDAGTMLGVAATLTDRAQRIGALASVLAVTRDGSIWEGQAGDAFRSRVAAVPPSLDLVAQRYAGAAAALARLAPVLEETQAEATAAIAEHLRAHDQYAVLEERAAVLSAGGASEDSPEVAQIRREQIDQVRRWQAADDRHARAIERFRGADAACVDTLRGLAQDRIVDSTVYRLVVGAGDVGRCAASLGPVGRAAHPLAALAIAGGLVATASEAALLLAYGEGDWSSLATTAALTAVGSAGKILKTGSLAGTRALNGGYVADGALSSRERIRFGVGESVRGRRDALLARAAAPRLAPGLPPPPLKLTTNGALRLAEVRVSAQARAQFALLDDWQRASAGVGGSGRAMYLTGSGLTVSSKAAGSLRE